VVFSPPFFLSLLHNHHLSPQHSWHCPRHIYRIKLQGNIHTYIRRKKFINSNNLRSPVQTYIYVDVDRKKKASSERASCHQCLVLPYQSNLRSGISARLFQVTLGS
jgi:hypothetical protein